MCKYEKFPSLNDQLVEVLHENKIWEGIIYCIYKKVKNILGYS